MKVSYPNTFARGQKLARYLLAAAIGAGLIGLLFFPENSVRQTVCVLLSAAFLAATVVAAARLCRCPACGKRILGGVLVLEVCPRCKRSLYTGDKTKKTKKR